jgi:predicted N-formylglutamate amidohydrolase
MSERAFEIFGDPARGGPFLFTCEHATNEMHGRGWTDADRAFIDDHWGWDIGAADVTRALCVRTRSAGVLANFSRLLVDPNRRKTSDTYIVREIDGHALSFNRDVSDDERAWRDDELYDGYHRAIDDAVIARKAQGSPFRLVSIHSFTPVFMGHRRDMEIGVLYDDHEDEARALALAIEEQGFSVVENEPYSGKSGMMASVQKHGRAHHVVHVEIEIRNDLLRVQSSASDVSVRLANALRAYLP